VLILPVCARLMVGHINDLGFQGAT